MAVSTLFKSQLRLYFVVDYDENGEEILKSKNFNNINIEADASQLYEVTQALVPLQQLPLHSVERNDSSEIVQA